MKVMIDTNIIISAVLFPNGTAAEAFKKALAPPFEPLICSYIVEELQNKFLEKFPHKLQDFEHFINFELSFITKVPIPEKIIYEESLIRDSKDRVILRAAINANADLLLTGDKDFLEANISRLRIISAREFIYL